MACHHAVICHVTPCHRVILSHHAMTRRPVMLCHHVLTRRHAATCQHTMTCHHAMACHHVATRHGVSSCRGCQRVVTCRGIIMACLGIVVCQYFLTCQQTMTYHHVSNGGMLLIRPDTASRLYCSENQPGLRWPASVGRPRGRRPAARCAGRRQGQTKVNKLETRSIDKINDHKRIDE